MRRGSQAYLQAYAHITANNPRWSAGKRRRIAWRYLRMSASPPLTRQERRSAKAERRRIRKAE